MKSTAENPLAFLEWYFKKQIIIDYDNFYNLDADFLIQDGLIEVISIDKENHVIEFKNIAEVDGLKETFRKDFKNYLNDKLLKEIDESILFIEGEFLKRFSDNNEVKSYAVFLRIKIRNILTFKAFDDFPFLHKYVSLIEETINRYSIEIKAYGFIPSFTILAVDENDQFNKIEKLYNLLTESPSIISCTKDEFFNAFSGKEVLDGIHWLVIGKNKFASKPSLFYLINELINYKHLNNSIIHDLNKYVLYTFRDNNGAEFKNLKQSKSFISEKYTQKDRIDHIVSSL